MSSEQRFRATLEEWAANNYDGAPDADKTAPENVIHSKGLDAAIDSLDVPDLDGALEDYADDAEVLAALKWLRGRLLRSTPERRECQSGGLHQFMSEVAKDAKQRNRSIVAVFNETEVRVYPDSSPGDLCRIYDLIRKVDHIRRGLCT